MSWEDLFKKAGKDVMGETEALVKENSKLLKEHKVKTVLDVGCGAGRNAIFLAQEGFKVTGLDNSPTALKLLKEKAQKLGQNIETRKGDMAKMPFENESFDAVISIFALQHGRLEDIKGYLKEIYRVIKPNGLFVFNVLSEQDHKFGIGKEIEHNTFIDENLEGEEDIPHHYFSEEEILAELNGFEVIEIKPFSRWGARTKGVIGVWNIKCQKRTSIQGNAPMK